MIRLLDMKEDCFGCWGCVNACPKVAIKMIEDNEGFMYPEINEEQCIECGICIKVCPAKNKFLGSNSINPPVVLAAWNLDENAREISSSGGVFSAISKYVLEQSGVVFGAVFDSHLCVVHKSLNNSNSLKEMCGSKYVQSQIGNTYREVRDYLNQDVTVLFTGTPCQIAGLDSFLQRKYNNLLTCDVVCHGVPSPKVFRKYINNFKEQFHSDLGAIFFRDKKFGWKLFSVVMKFVNGKVYSEPLTKDAFMQGFLKNIYLRPSCHKCPYSSIPRVGDITLGDFWDVGSKHPELDDDKGTSLLLINTQKGQEVLSKCSKNLYYSECDLEHAIAGNPCIVKPVMPSKDRKEFFKDLDHMSFKKIIKKYMREPSRTQKIIDICNSYFRAAVKKS